MTDKSLDEVILRLATNYDNNASLNDTLTERHEADGLNLNEITTCLLESESDAECLYAAADLFESFSSIVQLSDLYGLS